MCYIATYHNHYLLWPLEPQKAPQFYKGDIDSILQKPEYYENCLFKIFLCSKPCLQSEIFCIKAVFVACSCAVSNSGLVHTYEQREQAIKTVVRWNISL